MNASSLSHNGVQRIYNNKAERGVRLQVLDILPMPHSQEGKERFRLVASDGALYIQSMLATQMNHFVYTNCLKKLSIIQVDDYAVNDVKGQTLVVLVNITVVQADVSHQIGSPQSILDVNHQLPPQQQPYTAPQPSTSTNYAAGTSPYGAKPAGTAPSYGGSAYGQGPVESNPLPQDTIPIHALNPYMHRWTIKARVTNKGPMKTWSNQRGEGKLFSVDLLDSSGGEIRATMFNDSADKLMDIFHEGQVYLISRGQIKVANKQWTHLKNDYELTLNRECEVTLVQEDRSILHQKFDFVGISSLNDIEKDSYVDICCVVLNVAPIVSFTSQRTNREIQKRVLTVTDRTDASVEVTLWGAEAEKFDEELLSGQPVVALKGCRVSDFGGRSLSTVQSTTLVVRPDLPQAHQLQSWFEQRGNAAPAKSLSSRGGGAHGPAEPKTCADIKNEELGLRDPNKPDYLSLTGTITALQYSNDKHPWYLACPAPDCKKKVNDTGSGQWYCEKCSKSYPTCCPRYVMSFLVSDETGSQWVSAFNEIGEQILQGRTADELRRMDEAGESATVQAYFRRANFNEYTFTIRAKADTSQEQVRLRCTALGLESVDHKAQARRALDLIRNYA